MASLQADPQYKQSILSDMKKVKTVKKSAILFSEKPNHGNRHFCFQNLKSVWFGEVFRTKWEREGGEKKGGGKRGASGVPPNTNSWLRQ